MLLKLSSILLLVIIIIANFRKTSSLFEIGLFRLVSGLFLIGVLTREVPFGWWNAAVFIIFAASMLYFVIVRIFEWWRKQDASSKSNSG